jgi:hypothetical protein
MRRILVLAAGLMVCLLSVSAEAAIVRYLSQHPLPRRVGGGFCYIDVPHVHDFGPSDPRMYRQVDGQYYFVGDPAPFDYEGPRHAYYGPHPIVEANVQFGHPEYCYLQGPHYHWYEPPPQATFELRGGAYWYTGVYEPVYYEERPRYVVVNDAYAPIVYTRPVVDITVAPPAFRGEIVAGGPGWRGRAIVAAPPPPVVQVGVGINVGGPPSTVVVEHNREWERHEHEREEWERHDNGRHRGWEKHEGGERGGPRGGWRAQPAPVAHAGNWRASSAPPPQGGWRANPSPQPQAHGGGGGPHGGGKPSHGGGWKR